MIGKTTSDRSLILNSCDLLASQTLHNMYSHPGMQLLKMIKDMPVAAVSVAQATQKGPIVDPRLFMFEDTASVRVL